MDFRQYVEGRNPRAGEAAVYVLDGPNGVGYVGSTKDRLNKRVRNHWRWAVGDRMILWLRTLTEPPTLRVLMYVPVAERFRWEKVVIAAHVAEGHTLNNTRYL